MSAQSSRLIVEDASELIHGDRLSFLGAAGGGGGASAGERDDLGVERLRVVPTEQTQRLFSS